MVQYVQYTSTVPTERTVKLKKFKNKNTFSKNDTIEVIVRSCSVATKYSKSLS
jgi:hypothetical protein